MKTKILMICSLIFLITLNGFAVEETSNQDLNEKLKNVLVNNFSAYEKEDIALIMETVHPDSPGFAATKEFSVTIFPMFDIKYELLDFKYIAKDGDFAIARAKQKTTKISGPQFRNNILDSIVIMKQDGNIWKLWSQATLGIEYLN